MPIAFRTVTSDKNYIRFSERVNAKSLRDFIEALDATVNRGHRHVVLDFRRSQLAYADAVLPMISLVDHRRRRGDTFQMLLPDAPSLSRLFLNANWAHFFDASHPRVDLETKEHLAARRYLNHAEQQDAVNAAVDVVLRNLELGRDAIAALEWSANEITDNVLNHAESRDGGIVQVSTFRDEQKVQFVVSDAGRGIPAAMRTAFPQLREDSQAIAEAIKAGVTSIPDSGQGNGLAGSLRIAQAAEGSFKITSGKAQLTVFKDQRTSKYRTKPGRAPHGLKFPGTVVMMELSTDAAFDIEDALALGGRPSGLTGDVVDLRYSGNGGNLVVRVREETVGYGSRQAGVELRRKCQNLLNAEPDKRLILDWSGIPLVSSSFADEAVGKLFVELGPTIFSSRVAHTGTESLVRSLLDRAVMQRVVQSLGSNES